MNINATAWMSNPKDFKPNVTAQPFNPNASAFNPQATTFNPGSSKPAYPQQNMQFNSFQPAPP